MATGARTREGRLLSGAAIMITGASSGIGAAAARLFAAEGASVALMARRADRLRALTEEITAAGGQACAVPGDVTDPADVKRAVQGVLEAYGHLDGAFNNAGWGTAGTPLHRTEDVEFQEIFDVNVRGAWNCLKAQIDVMLTSGRGGSIVNTASTAGLLATGAGAAYVAAKHAVIGLTRAAAHEYGQQGIRVNALVVGSTRTELIKSVLTAAPELEEQFVNRSAQKRLAEPDEVAQAAAWLFSDRASFVTGAALPVDGGWTAS